MPLIIFIFLNKIIPVRKTNLNLYWAIMLCICCVHAAEAQIKVIADRPRASYDVGEVMNFQVTSTESGEASFIIRRDNHSPILEKGTFYLEAGETYNLPFTFEEPAFLICYVNQGDFADRAGIAFSPFDIIPIEQEPADFDAFWNAQKAEMREIPSNPVLTKHSENNFNTTYDLVMDHIDGRKVYGYISIPKGDGPFPAFLVMPSFGGGANHVTPGDNEAAQINSIVIRMSIHNANPAEGDPDLYTPNDISTREGNYYRYALMAGVRCIDYLFERDDFDKENMGVMGISQGGGLSIIMSGLDQRIKLLVHSVPALCQHNGLTYDRESGHPYFLFSSRTTAGTPEHEQSTADAIRYYDAINFAKRFKGPSTLFLSYEDHVCPPGTVMAANNVLTGGPKIIMHSRETTHDAPDYPIKRFDTIRNFMPETRNADAAVSQNLGYNVATQTSGFLEAVNSPFQLSATVSLEEQILDLESSWEKVSGPGKAIFSEPTSGTTTVHFDKPGTYTIKYTALDDRFIEQTTRWVTVHDYITLFVE